MVHRVVYMSTLRNRDCSSDLRELEQDLTASHTEMGVTSVAIRTPGVLLHAIEGDEPAVRRALASAQADPRHHDFLTLEDTAAATRVFGHAPARCLECAA